MKLNTMFREGKFRELGEYAAQLLESGYGDDGFVWKALGSAQYMLECNAEYALRKAVEFLPFEAESWFNLANEVERDGRLFECAEYLKRAIECKPELREPYNNLGNICLSIGYNKQAESSFRRCIAIKPDAEVHSNLIFAMDLSGEHTMEELAAERSEWNRVHAAPLYPKPKGVTMTQGTDITNPSIAELYCDRYDTLKEDAAAVFLLSLKKEWRVHDNKYAGEAFRILAHRWIDEPIRE